MASLNQYQCIGRIGKEPEIRYTQGGKAVASFSVAVDEGYKDRQTGQKVDKTEWVNMVAWGNQAEFINNYLGRGRLVFISGKLSTRKWQDNNGNDRYTTEIIIQNIQPLDKKPNQQQGQNQGGYQQQSQGGGYQQQGMPQGGDDDLGPAFPTEASGMDDVPF